MKKIICMFGCILGFVIGCGSPDVVIGSTGSGGSSSTSVVSSSSSGEGGSGGLGINYVDNCFEKKLGTLCKVGLLTGVCEHDICVSCDGWGVKAVKSGYPLDKGACFSIVCDVGPVEMNLAYWQQSFQPEGKDCSTEGIEGHCVSDGRCCDVDTSKSPPAVTCSSFPKNNQ